MNELLVVLFMSAVCVGMRIAMSEGHIFEFIRKPVIDRMKKVNDTHKERKKEIQDLAAKDKAEIIDRHRTIESAYNELNYTAALYKDMIEDLDKKHDKEIKRNFYWLKPLVICVYCFSSFWGSLAFFGIHYLYLHDTATAWPIWIPSVFMCLCLNAILDGIMSKIRRL